MKLLKKIFKLKKLEENLQNFLLAKLYILYYNKTLNRGNLPKNRTAYESVTINDIYILNSTIYVEVEIWFGRDSIELITVCKTEEEWNEI